MPFLKLFQSSFVKTKPRQKDPTEDHWKSLNVDQLQVTTDAAAAEDIFKRAVHMVEIEIFSYCNRRCWFCPNATNDRISANIFMEPGLYTSIIDQLATISYDGTISYSRYNEPLADRVILDRIRYAHQCLPGALLHTNTNGDYLNPAYLDDLYAAGLRSMNIQIYLKNEERYDHDRVMERGEQILGKLNLPHDITVNKPGERYELSLTYRDMALRLYGRNFEVKGTSRGGQVDINRDYVRTAPCLLPYWSVYIDHNGKMVPCCNFRSDVDEHADYVTADLSRTGNLFLAYTSAQTVAFRRSLLNNDVKEGLCSNCFFAVEKVNSKRTAQMERLIKT